MTANLNGTNLAKYMFVIGPGNSTKAKNIEVSKKLSSISQSLFPGLIRSGNGSEYGIYYHRTGTKFNQQKNGNLVLIEMGSQTNTLDEAKTTGLYLSRIIAEYINGKK
jgi:stage II sporulation protein P